MANLSLTKAKEILQKIKEKKLQELGESNITITTPTQTPIVASLTTAQYSYQQEYKLYLNLVVYYIRNPSIIPPLHPYQKMLKKIVPRVYETLYANGTYYGMIDRDVQLLSYIIRSTTIDTYNKVTSTLLASVKLSVLRDIRIVLETLLGEI